MIGFVRHLLRKLWRLEEGRGESRKMRPALYEQYWQKSRHWTLVRPNIRQARLGKLYGNP